VSDILLCPEKMAEVKAQHRSPSIPSENVEHYVQRGF